MSLLKFLSSFFERYSSQIILFVSCFSLLLLVWRLKLNPNHIHRQSSLTRLDRLIFIDCASGVQPQNKFA